MRAGPESPLLAQRQDPTLGAGLGLRRTAMGPTRTVLEAGEAFFLVAAPPDIGPVPRDPHGRRGMSHGPTTFDALAEQQSTLRGSVGRYGASEASLVSVVLSSSSTLALEASFRVDPVSKVRGHYS